MLRQAGTTGALGIEIAVALAIGYFGGRYLDRRLDTAPVLTWLGFLAGVGAAVKALVRVVRAYNRAGAPPTGDGESTGRDASGGPT